MSRTAAVATSSVVPSSGGRWKHRWPRGSSRVVSVVVGVMLIVSVGAGPLATHLPAAANGSCLAGAGTPVNPYLVTSAVDLAKVGSGTDGCTLSASYLQTANITLAAPVAGDSNHTPIGSFTGVYDGGGFTIDGPVVVVDGNDVGFFGSTSGATIRDVHITRGSITGGEDTGGLIGQAANSTVSGTSFSGTVTSSANYVGGLIGYAPFTGVFRSFSEGTVTGGTDVGGLVGYLPFGGVRASFSTADVNGTGSNVGGLVGYFPGSADALRVTGSAVATSSVATSSAGASIVAGDTFTWSVDLDPFAGSTSSTPSFGNTFNNSVQAFKLVASPGNTGTWVPNATVWGISPAFNVFANANGNGLTIQLKDASGAPDINSVPFLDVALTLQWADADLDAVWQAGTVTLAQWFRTTRPPLEAANLSFQVRDTGLNSPTFAVTLAQDLNFGLQAGDLIDSFARGDVTVTGTANGLGGLSGYVPSSAISRVYTTGAVSGTGSNIGGLVGQDASTSFTDSFWDTQTSGRATSPAGTGKTTAQLTSRATFADTATVGLTTAWPIVAGWAPYVDGTTVWGICTGVNDGYPFLLWQFDTDPCSAPVSSSSLALSCEGTRAVGTKVTCTVTGGDAGIDILWRAAYNPVIAETGVTLDASGSGEFSFTVPAAALGEALTVELVDWTAPMSLGVVGGPVPGAVPTGSGSSSPAGRVLLLVLVGLTVAVVLRRRMHVEV